MKRSDSILAPFRLFVSELARSAKRYFSSGGEGQTQASPHLSAPTVALLLASAAILPYLNALRNGFVFDDKTQILDNPFIVSFGHLPAVLTSGVWSYQGAAGITNYYRPVMNLGYLLCYKLFGASAYGFHLANILLNAAVVFLLFELTRRLFGRRDLAIVAAAAFALHPIHTEAVAWIASVTELEVAFFFLLTFRLFLAVPARRGWKRVLGMGGMATAFVLALLSKEQALVLPLLALIYEHFYRDDRAETSWRIKLSRYGGLWFLCGAYLVFRLRFLGSFAPVDQYPDVTGGQTILSAVVLLGQCLAKLVWPARLKLYYAFHPSASVLDPQFLWGIAALLVCLLLLTWLWRRARKITFGMVWIFATLAPVLNCHWLAVNVFSERYLYLPSVGFCWLLAWGLLRLWESAQRRRPAWRAVWAGGLALVTAFSAARIVTRNRVWHDDFTLYTTALEASPEAFPIHLNLGALYYDLGEVRNAERQWIVALHLAPRYPVTWNDLGLAYREQKRYSEAEAMFRKALEIAPDYADARLNLGVMYERMGLMPEAEREMRASLALAPRNLHARNRLGLMCFAEGRLPEAEMQFRSSLAVAPNVVAYDALGEIYLLRGDPGPAEQSFKSALALNPVNVTARLRLGGLYAAQNRKAKAIAEYQAVLKLQPQNLQAREALSRLNADESHAPAHP